MNSAARHIGWVCLLVFILGTGCTGASGYLADKAEPAKAAGASSTTPARPTPEETDCTGLYFFPGGPGGLRVLSIDSTKRIFDITEYGPLGGTISGYCLAIKGGLSVQYFNGQERAGAGSTCAVVDGDLWIGVMRHLISFDFQTWCSYSQGARFFGPAAAHIPDANVEWHPDKHLWRYSVTPQAGENIAIEKVDVMDFPLPTTAKTPAGAAQPAATQSTGLLPVFPNTPEVLRMRKLWSVANNFEQGTDFGSITPYGLILPGASPHGGQLPQALTDLLARWPGVVPPVYRPRGDILLTPWSVNLGKVGLVAAKIDLKDAVGKWVSETDPKRTLTIVPPVQERPLLLLPRGPGLKEQEESLEYAPDSRGIVVKCYNYDSGGDFVGTPGHIAWIPLSPARAACYTVPATHSTLTGGMEFFRRAESPPPAARP